MEQDKRTPTEWMNDTYKCKAPKFPDHLQRSDSDNILLYMTQRIPMKVGTERKHVVVMLLI